MVTMNHMTRTTPTARMTAAVLPMAVVLCCLAPLSALAEPAKAPDGAPGQMGSDTGSAFGDEIDPVDRYNILINQTRLSIPGPYIWNRDLRRNAVVGSINLFMVMPGMTALPEFVGPGDTGQDQVGPGSGNGFGPVILANLTSLTVDSTAAELFESFAQDGYWDTAEVDRARDGLHRLSGPINQEGQGRWYAILRQGEVDVLLNCMTAAMAPYPSCTAHSQIWDELALRVNFDASRLPGFAEWWPDFGNRLADFRAEGSALDL